MRLPDANAPTLATGVSSVVGVRGDAEALVVDDVRLGYRELWDRSVCLAERLGALGVGAGDLVLLVLPSDDLAVTAFIALAHGGGAAVPIEPMWPPSELRAIAGQFPGTWAIVDWAALSPAHAAAFDEHDRALLLDAREINGPRGPRPTPGRARPPLSQPHPAAIFFTSGTSGRPAGVAHTPASLLRSLRSLAGAPPSATGQQTWLTPIPLSTIGGYTIMSRVLLLGDRLVLVSRFHPRQVLELVERERVTCLGVTPEMLWTLVRTPGLSRYDLSSVGIVGVGSSALSAELADRAAEVFGAPVVNSYGSTELGGPVLMAMPDDPLSFDVTDSVDVRVVCEAGAPALPGEPGELECRVADFMLGYYENGELIAPPTRAGGWYRTGDRAVVTPSGKIRYLGRCDDAIVRSGVLVQPVVVEHALLRHPEVAQAAVVGVQGPSRTEVWALVTPVPGSEVTGSELVRHCRGALPAASRPNRILLTSRLPTTSTGKVRKHLLGADPSGWERARH